MNGNQANLVVFKCKDFCAFLILDNQVWSHGGLTGAVSKDKIEG